MPPIPPSGPGRSSRASLAVRAVAIPGGIPKMNDGWSRVGVIYRRIRRRRRPRGACSRGDGRIHGRAHCLADCRADDFSHRRPDRRRRIRVVGPCPSRRTTGHVILDAPRGRLVQRHGAEAGEGDLGRLPAGDTNVSLQAGSLRVQDHAVLAGLEAELGFSGPRPCSARRRGCPPRRARQAGDEHQVPGLQTAEILEHGGE